MQKVEAVEKKDEATIAHLKEHYPELFDATFLLDVVRNEFERSKAGLDDEMIFKNYLFKYH